LPRSILSGEMWGSGFSKWGLSNVGASK
jgi:hypothetical protein